MNDLNLCQFIGRIGNPAEVRFMPNGKAVANFSIACNRTWKDQSGQKQEKTEWVRCTAYGKLAEVINEYTGKGSQLYVSGRQSTRKWQDNQGQDKYATEIIVDQMQMLGGRSEGANQGQGGQGGGYQARAQNQNAPQNQAGQPQSKPPMGEPDFDFDDDIPF